MPPPGQYAAHSRKRRGNKHRKMNGAHRESHDDARPLLPRRRRLRPAHPLQTACFPKPRLFISFARFSPQHAFRAGIRRTFSRSKQNAPPLPASARLFFFLSPQSRPVRCHILSVFLLPLPARSSAFRLNAILSVVTFPLHVTFPCSRFRLSPQSRPSVVTSLFPLAFPACAFFFSPILSLPPEKGSKKSPSLTEKTFCLRLFPIRPIKKPSQREL